MRKWPWLCTQTANHWLEPRSQPNPAANHVSIALTVEAAVDEVAHAVASENATSVLTASTTVLMLANTLRASVTTTRSGKDGGLSMCVKSWK